MRARSACASALALLSTACFTLTACQSAMTVEEAKKVSAQFADKPFVPPPRTIRDITAILDRQSPADAAALKATLARLEQPPPATAGPSDLATFYRDRGSLAHELGRVRQAREDLGRAVEYSRQARSSAAGALEGLARAEFNGGSISSAVTHLKEGIAEVPSFERGRLISFNALLAALVAQVGDLQAADAALGEMTAVLSQSAGWPDVSPGNRAVWRALAAYGQGNVAEARGRFAEAEALYRETVAEAGQATALGYPNYVLITNRLRVPLIDVLVREGKLLEAENEARSALLWTVRTQGRYSMNTAYQLGPLVRAIAEQGRYAEAETLVRAMGDILDRVGASAESSQRARARNTLGEILAAQGRWSEALAVYDQLRQSMAADSQAYEKQFAGSITRALTLVHGGRAQEALAALESTLAQVRQAAGEDHPSTAELRGALGVAYAALGDQRRALDQLRRAEPVLLASRPDGAEAGSVGRAGAQQRRWLILSAYVDLLARIRGTPLEREANLDAAAEAFRVADVVRTGAVQRALDLSAARAAAKTPALAALVRQEQDVSQQVGAFQGLLANALSQPPDQQNTRAVESLRQQIATLQRARQALGQQIEREFPTYAELVNPRPATVAQVRTALRQGEALIATLVTAERTFLWAIPASGPVAFAAVPLGERELTASIAEIRKALEPTVEVVGDIPPLDLARAYEIYRSLLDPVKAGWAGASSLLVVAHGPLGQLPFSLLPTRPTALGAEQGGLLFSSYRAVPWLIRTHAVTVLPSVASLATLRALPPGDQSRRAFVGFGNPYFSEEQARRASAQPSGNVAAHERSGVALTVRSSPKTGTMDSSRLAVLPPLPETADEIRSMALAMHADLTRDVFLGERANEQTVRTLELSGYRVIAFATHGLVPGDLDGLTQPALALSAPEVAKVEGDGLLTMEKILGLRLNADWVVLSACNTASGNGAGSEAISGLGRAFFYAGARALLVSNWPVETSSAKALTTELFRVQGAQPGLTRAQALQQAMLWLIDHPGYTDPLTKKTAFSYAHPLFWAPFTLVGDGGGAPADRR
jgi:CHAT domain-containing protein